MASVLHPDQPEYNQDLEPWPFDMVAAATKLLAEAGWADSDGDGVIDKMVGDDECPFVLKCWDMPIIPKVCACCRFMVNC